MFIENITDIQQNNLIKTSVQILHKHVWDVSYVLRRVQLGVADELASQFPQFGHVETPGEVNVITLS